MFKITLISMPFASLNLPSLALTQLKSVAERQFGDQIRARILYLGHDFAHYLGLELYQIMTSSLAANNSGLGDWFFRQAAFPHQTDNSEEYFRRYFPQRSPEIEARRLEVEGKRKTLDRFLERLVLKYRLDQENLVGFTSMFAQNAASFALARQIKGKNPKTVTVIGGANCEAPMGRELALHVDALDYVVSGPGLVTFPQLLRCLIAGEAEGIDAIRGVFTRRNAADLAGQMWMGPELPIEIPVPLDYGPFLDELARNFPHNLVKPSLTFETSRGCWWGERSHCTFCGLNGTTMAYRAMPADQAVELFQGLFDRYSDRCERFESVDNILPRSYLKEVLPRLKPPEHVRVFYEVKADLKAHEMEILAQAKISELQPGIESINSSTLKLMGKGTTAFGNVRFLKYCVKHQIAPVWNLLIGFPREEEEVYKKYLADIPLLKHLPPPSGAHPVRFDRYSPYYVKAAEYGLKLKPYDFYSFIYPFPAAAIANLAYYFEDTNYSADYIRKMVVWADKLNAAVRDWQKHYYGHEALPKAELFLAARGQGQVVHDTRSGTLVEHEISALGLQLLDLLGESGLNHEHLVRATGATAAAVAAEVDRLRELGLLFEESNRYISVVLALGVGAAESRSADWSTSMASSSATPRMVQVA
jgi:ribosomal peptide maturation radical SAM protein 1